VLYDDSEKFVYEAVEAKQEAVGGCSRVEVVTGVMYSTGFEAACRIRGC
jgi:hypothetical protein